MSRTSRAVRALAAASVLTAALAVGAGPALADESVTAEAQVAKVGPDSVNLVVSVQGLAANDVLDPRSVRVYSGGKRWSAKADVAALPRSGSAVTRTAVLVVDRSGSMGTRGMAEARAAATGFLAVVPPDVAVGLVTFSDRARLIVRPTREHAELRAALAQMRPKGATSLYDGISVGLTTLGTKGERALVVLSDGKDTSSTATLASTSAALRNSGAAVDLVSFGTAGGQRQTLEALADGGGGRVAQTDNAAQLAKVFATAAQTLANKLTIVAQIPRGARGDDVADLVVEVAAGNATATAEVRVDLPTQRDGATVGTASGARSEVQPSPSSLLPLVVGAAFVALFLIFWVLLAPSTWRPTPSQQRHLEIERYTLGGTAATGNAGTRDAAPAAVTQAALAWAGRTVKKRGVEDSWRLKLERAGIPLRPQEWLIIRLAVALSGFAFAVLVLPLWPLTGVVLFLGGWLLTGGYVRIKGQRRGNRFAENLPDVLQLMAGSLRSGFSLPQAVDNAARDGEQPMAAELSRALAESRLGVDLEDALEGVAERMDSKDLSWTIMAIRISKEVGGNLAEVLLSTGETMRERARIQRQVKVLSAEGRLSAYVLLGLPIGITLWMMAFRRSYIAPLITEPLGLGMTTYGVLSVMIGAWWMSRLVKLDV